MRRALDGPPNSVGAGEQLRRWEKEGDAVVREPGPELRTRRFHRLKRTLGCPTRVAKPGGSRADAGAVLWAPTGRSG